MSPRLRRLALSIALAAAATASLLAAGGRQAVLQDQRRRLGLVQADPVENLPPWVAFSSVAFGPFRGLLVDLLWVRASTLQQQGRYVELVQLSEWITRLQPRFESIWAYHAWNLAYNVSVLFDAPEDRWRWVRHGLHLLRDQGLPCNPGSAPLHRELALFYEHKLGADLDRAHGYYKKQWALEMTGLNGGPRPDERALAVARLDPVRLREVDERYGPLDWRLPGSHAVYWAELGMPLARTRTDRILQERQLLRSLTHCFLHGRLDFDPAADRYVLTPDPDLVRPVRAAYAKAVDRGLDDLIRISHRNFLVDATMICALFDRLPEARELHAELLRRYAEDQEPDFDRFIVHAYLDFAGRVQPDRWATPAERALYQAAYWAAQGDTAQAAGYERLARNLRDSSAAGPEEWESLRRAARERLRAEGPSALPDMAF